MLKSVTFEVIGEQQLHCEACQHRVERMLKALQGVTKVRAEALSQRIEVLFDAAVLESAAIAKRLGEAGYETGVPTMPSNSGQSKQFPQSGPLAEVELFIPSMVCEGCAERLTTLLNALPGVRKVNAKVRKKQLSIQYEPGRIQIEQLQNALEKAGYAAVEAQKP